MELRELMDARGMTQKAIRLSAERAGYRIDAGNLCRVVKGDRPPFYPEAKAIAAGLMGLFVPKQLALSVAELRSCPRFAAECEQGATNGKS